VHQSSRPSLRDARRGCLDTGSSKRPAHVSWNGLRARHPDRKIGASTCALFGVREVVRGAARRSTRGGEHQVAGRSIAAWQLRTAEARPPGLQRLAATSSPLTAGCRESLTTARGGWWLAAMNSVEPPLLSLLVLDWTADGSCGKHRELLVGWANRVLTNLERWFADRDFRRDKGFHRRRHPDGARALGGHQGRGIDRAVSANRVVSGSVPGSARVEADHRGVLRAGRGGIDRHRRRRRVQSHLRRKAPACCADPGSSSSDSRDVQLSTLHRRRGDLATDERPGKEVIGARAYSTSSGRLGPCLSRGKTSVRPAWNMTWPAHDAPEGRRLLQRSRAGQSTGSPHHGSCLRRQRHTPIGPLDPGFFRSCRPSRRDSIHGNTTARCTSGAMKSSRCSGTQRRRISFRFEKLDAVFLGFLSFVLVVDGLRVCVNTP
jgi:hypothetical protein